MIKYPNEILDFIKDIDGLNLKNEDSIAIINTKDLSLVELLHTSSDLIYFISENEILKSNVKQNYPNVNVIHGNEVKTEIGDKIIRYKYTDENINNFNIYNTRQEFKRILRNCWDDLIIVENKEKIKNNILIDIFAGSWYERKKI